MADLTADKVRQRELPGLNDIGAAASTTLYEGQLIGNSAGYGRALVAGDIPVGFLKDAVDNSAGGSGDKRAYVFAAGRVQLTVTGVAVTDLGKAVYASADDTFTFTRGTNSFVGRVTRYVTTDTCMVEFDFERGGLGKQDMVDWQTNGTNLGAPNAGTLTRLIMLQKLTYNGTDIQNNMNILADAINRLAEMVK